MTSFIPKSLDLQFLHACKETLTPSSDSAAVAARDHRPLKRFTMTFNEKRLDIRIWQFNGNHQKCSHFPICVFTNNISRRSPEKLEERYKRWVLRRRMETSHLVRTRTRLGPTLALDQWIPNIQPGQHHRTMVSPQWGRMGSGRCADVDRSRG